MDSKNIHLIAQAHPILFYDGECVLCDRTVQFILKRDEGLLFRFMSIQAAVAENFFPKKINGLSPKKLSSTLLLYQDQWYIYERAAIKSLSLLGGQWRLLSYIINLFPTLVSRSIYKTIAKHRYQIFGRQAYCAMPDAKWKASFI